MKIQISYERFMAWAAGPISALAGWGSTLLLKYVPISLGKDQTAKAIVWGTTFVVGTGVTWLTHQKWFNNLTKWWDHTIGGKPIESATTAVLEQTTKSKGES